MASQAKKNTDNDNHGNFDGVSVALCVHNFIMAESGVIYKITSPSNRVYIGQTTNFIKRHTEYKTLASASEDQGIV